MSEYYAVRYSYSLSHHGIKGQKWGDRRYQNEDGSLTEEGRRRYGILGSMGRGISRMSNAIRQNRVNRNARSKKVWRTDSKQYTSSNKQLGRKINASYEVRKARGEKLSNAGRTRVGAIGRGVVRSVGRTAGLTLLNTAAVAGLGYAAMKTGNASLVTEGAAICKLMFNTANIYGGVSNAIRTYQDLADITTYQDTRNRRR